MAEFGNVDEGEPGLDGFLGYLVFCLVAVIGGLAVFLAMPGPRRTGRIAPVILGAVGIAALLGYLVGVLGCGRIVFYILAALAVIGAARVVTHHKPVYSAVYFILLVLCVAGIAILTGAEYLGAALVIVYAGAILVTYVFVIMLAQQPTPSECDVEAREPLFAVLAGFVLIASLASVIFTSHKDLADADPGAAGVASAKVVSAVKIDSAPDRGWSNSLALGTELMVTYPVAFEAAGVLLLVGIIGGISLATRRLDESGGAA